MLFHWKILYFCVILFSNCAIRRKESVRREKADVYKRQGIPVPSRNILGQINVGIVRFLHAELMPGIEIVMEATPSAKPRPPAAPAPGVSRRCV